MALLPLVVLMVVFVVMPADYFSLGVVCYVIGTCSQLLIQAMRRSSHTMKSRKNSAPVKPAGWYWVLIYLARE